MITLKANLILLVTDEYTCLVRPKKEKKKCQAVVVASWILRIHLVVGDQSVIHVWKAVYPFNLIHLCNISCAIRLLDLRLTLAIATLSGFHSFEIACLPCLLWWWSGKK